MNGFVKTFPGGYNQRKKNIRTVKIIQLCCFWKWLWIRMVYGVLLWCNLASWREHPPPPRQEITGASWACAYFGEHLFKRGAFHAAHVFCWRRPGSIDPTCSGNLYGGDSRRLQILGAKQMGGAIQNLERQLEHCSEKKEIEESHAPSLMTGTLSKFLWKI